MTSMNSMNSIAEYTAEVTDPLGVAAELLDRHKPAAALDRIATGYEAFALAQRAMSHAPGDSDDGQQGRRLSEWALANAEGEVRSLDGFAWEGDDDTRKRLAEGVRLAADKARAEERQRVVLALMTRHHAAHTGLLPVPPSYSPK